MRRLPLSLLFLVAISLLPSHALGEDRQAVSLATHNSAPVDARAVKRIRKIVLNQGDDARALANLVQLSRELPAPTTAQLYYQLAGDYLSHRNYNQAANVLQQLVNQFPDEPLARDAVLRLVRIYASGEVQHSESVRHTGTRRERGEKGFSKYALHFASTALQNNRTLADDAAFIFQRSVAMRLDGRTKASLGALTRVKRDVNAEPWRTRAMAEAWLTTDRQEESPLPTVECRPAAEHPHLDGVLDEPFWRSGESVQFAYNAGFLYVAIKYPKRAGQNYPADSRPRADDADLSAHDHVRITLDVDRDYATAYHVAVDYRGWTRDRCWLSDEWNTKRFIAAHTDQTHWNIEMAIPMGALVYPDPKPGDAWALALQRSLPSAEPSPDDFRLLLFR